MNAEVATAASALLVETPHDAEFTRDRWPPEFARLRPSRVYATRDGLYVVTSQRFVRERGFFFPRSADFAPGTGTDPAYDPVGHGVFAYRIEG